jgi:hypothetical protein
VGLIAAGIASLLLLWAMAPMEDRVQENGAGIVTFELSGGQDRADEILAETATCAGSPARAPSVWLGALAAGFDALEKPAVYSLSTTPELHPLLPRIFATCKFALLAAAIVYLLTGITAAFWERNSTASGSLIDTQMFLIYQ